MVEEHSLEGFFTISPNPYFLCDTMRGVLDCNPAAEKLFGLNKKEMIGQILVAMNSGKGALPLLSKGETDFGTDVYLLEKRDSTPLYVQVSWFSPIAAGTHTVYAAVNDIHTQKSQEKVISSIVQNMREQERFLRHEMANFIGPIKGFSQFLLDEKAGSMDKNKKTILQSILKASDLAINFIDELKVLSDLERGEYVLKKRKGSLESLISGVLSQLETQGKTREGEIVFENNAENTHILMDYDLLPAVFFNLINNAIDQVSQLTEPSERRIIVRLSTEGSTITASINHKGQPVPPEVLKLYFDKQNPRRNKKESTGLGLVFAYQVTVAHSGSISVVSDERDGTSVRVVFDRV